MDSNSFLMTVLAVSSCSNESLRLTMSDLAVGVKIIVYLILTSVLINP